MGVAGGMDIDTRGVLGLPAGWALPPIQQNAQPTNHIPGDSPPVESPASG
jgi:hypothetical protein